MDLVERYNRELLGNRFHIPFNYTPPYAFDKINKNGNITILFGNGNVNTAISISKAFEHIDCGNWVLDKTYLRKKKLKKLMNNDKQRKI